jgi:hypothetical protein
MFTIGGIDRPHKPKIDAMFVVRNFKFFNYFFCDCFLKKYSSDFAARRQRNRRGGCGQGDQ